MQAIPFDPLDYPHPSRRTVVYARNGMTCAGNPTAASVGLQVLLKRERRRRRGGDGCGHAARGAYRQRFGVRRLRDGMEGRQALWSQWFGSFT